MQECWALYPKTVGEFIDLPPEHMLFTGMAIGYTDRAPLDEVATFLGI